MINAFPLFKTTYNTRYLLDDAIEKDSLKELKFIIESFPIRPLNVLNTIALCCAKQRFDMIRYLSNFMKANNLWVESANEWETNLESSISVSSDLFENLASDKEREELRQYFVRFPEVISALKKKIDAQL